MWAVSIASIIILSYNWRNITEKNMVEYKNIIFPQLKILLILNR